MSTIPAGYKQTEVGVIPEEWVIATLPQVTEVIDGDRGHNYPSASDFNSYGYCLFLNASNVTSKGFQFAECMFISMDKDKKLSKGKLNRNDIVLTTRGSVGNYAYFDEKVPFSELRINSGMVIIRCTSKLLNSQFLYKICQSNILGRQIERLSFGSAQPQLTVKGIATLQFPLPPLPEQKRIAQVLGDVDALIQKLEALIAKKRDIKQASMQELLTGKRRLPGFSGTWETKRLGEVLTVCHGKNQKEVEVIDGEYPILATGGQIGTANRPLFCRPSVLIGRKGTIDRPQFMDTPFWTVDTLFYTDIKEGHSAKWLFYRFLLIDWASYNEASGVPSLNRAS